MSTTNVGEAFRPPAALPPWLPTRKPNRLPLHDYRQPGRFFVTIATAERRLWFREASVATYCEHALRAACEVGGFSLEAYCFMPDHVHLLVSSDGENDLVRLVHRFKQQTGWWFRNRHVAGGLKASPTNRHSLWQKSYYDHILRQEDDFEDVVWYILTNPVVAGIVDSPEEHPYTWSIFGTGDVGEAFRPPAAPPLRGTHPGLA